MSVFIHNIGIPKTGYVDVRLFSDGRATTQTGERPFYREMKIEEVPEKHGRLIDSDALHEELYALEYARENEWLDGAREAQGVDAARVALLDAPTIIPASDKDINVLGKEEGET